MRALQVVFLMMFSVSALAQVTHEEQVVRSSYAKLSFAAQIGMVWHTARGHEGWPRLTDSEALRHSMEDQLRFELSGFKVGKFSDIASQSWDSLVTSPDDVVNIEYREVPFTIDTSHSHAVKYVTYADTSWMRARKGDMIPQHPLSVKEELPHITSTGPELTVEGTQVWDRYASFGVVAILRGKTVTYRALFLFRKGKTGNETVLPLDFATQMGIVPFLNNSMYPSALTETSLREIPFVQGWISGNSIPGCKRSKSPEVCCNKKSEVCGLAAEDVNKSMEQQIHPETRKSPVAGSTTLTMK